MGVREVKIRFCDACGKTIEGRLTLHTCPKCRADICVECQLKEDSKHKPRERKPKPTAEEVATRIIDKVSVPPGEVKLKVEQAPPPPAEMIIEPPKKRGRKPSKDKPTPTLGTPDISTFSIKTPEPGVDGPYELRMGEIAVASMTLKEGAMDLLRAWKIDQKYVKNAPPSDGKTLLLDILKEGDEK